MKKKIISILLVGLVATAMFGCGETSKISTGDSTTKTEAPAKKVIPDGTAETGKGSIILRTAGGTSENGNVPVIFESKETQIDQIEIDSKDFDGSKLSFILVDGKEAAKEQLAEESQATFNLKGDMLKKGKHKVEVAQFEGDKTDGKILTYKTAEYEIKEK